MPVTRSIGRRTTSAVATATTSPTDTLGTTSATALTSTTMEESSQPTAVSADVEEQQAATQKSQLVPSKAASTVKQSSKARRLAQARTELARLKLELAAAKLAEIEAEESDGNASVISMPDGEQARRVDNWVRQSHGQPPPEENTPAVTNAPWLNSATAPAGVTLTPQTNNNVPTSMPAITAAPWQFMSTDQAQPTTQQRSPSIVPARSVTQERRVVDNTDKSAPGTCDLHELANAITQAVQAAQHKQPKYAELPSFNGAHQDWLTFRAAYYETAPHFTHTENTARLRRNLRGTAKEAVQGLLISNAGPEQIIKTLETRFGRPEAIAMAEMNKLRLLPRLTESPRDLCTFATKIQNALGTLDALNCAYFMYNPEVTKGLTEKLTPTLKRQWYEFSASQPFERPDLMKFNDFITREATICSPFASVEPVVEHTYPRTYESGTRRQTQRVHTATEKVDGPTCGYCAQGHLIVDCSKFADADVNTRWEEAKKHHLCFRCLKRRGKQHTCKPRRCDVNGCERFHHRMLHPKKRTTETVSTDEPEREAQINSAWTPQVSYLKIAPVRISGPKKAVDTFALLDDGSTVTLIDEQLSTAIGVDGPEEPLNIYTYDGATKENAGSRRVTFRISGKGRNLRTQSIIAHTASNLRLATQKIPEEAVRDCNHLKGLVAHIHPSEVRPRILIGQDNWHLLVANKTKSGRKNQPVASLTPLGWVIHGSRTRTIGRHVNFISYASTDDDQLSRLVEDYIAADNTYLQPRRPTNDPNEKALELLKQNTKRTADGHYETSLLWKRDNIEMPCNYESALNRLHGIERKLDKDPNLKAKYSEQMNALVEKDYAEPAPEITNNKKWYLPHFAVLNHRKPEKLRVVHDAAAKTRGVSLNDFLYTGPDLLRPLPGILMRFREHPVAVTADIAEMFLQVRLREEDRDALRYLWRGSSRDNSPPKEYRMKTLIFGASSSPATAIHVLNTNAERFKDRHPEAVAAIKNKHYMDDYIDSFPTFDIAVRISRQVRDIHREAHFELKKWASNSPELLSTLGETPQHKEVNLDDTTERVLGMIWRTMPDELAFDLRLTGVSPQILSSKVPTKRQALKIMMSIFDPLGLLSPLTIRPKQLLQEVWRRGTGWDDPVDDDIADQWNKWIARLKAAKSISIPRCYPNFSGASKIQLHVFTDASESAYAAALYWRTVSENDTVTVTLLAAKAKVAPLKLLSVPRMELQAAVLGARMAAAAREEHQQRPESTTYWTDSRTTLCWIRTGARSYKPYVAHRIAAIEEISKTSEWRWVPTKWNVADDATRDTPDDFGTMHRWFHGPEFLRENPSCWPVEAKRDATTDEERRTIITHVTASKLCNSAIPDVTRFSSWPRYLRATARVLQAAQIFRRRTHRVNYKRTKESSTRDPKWGSTTAGNKIRRPAKAPTESDKFIPLSAELQEEAELMIIRNSQRESFAPELHALQNGTKLPRDSRLYPLSVHLCEGIIKLKSRIAATSGVSEMMKNPAIIDGKHYATKLWIKEVHKKSHHAGVESVVNSCRQQRWVIRLRPTVKEVLSKCLECKLRSTKPPQPETGDLPHCRLAHHQKPFTYTGLDYFGPLTVTIGRTHNKRYVALFTCLTTRAVHLEVVHTLSTDSAIMALRRMMARRGCPAEIWSDNATNFHGAEKELRQVLQNGAERETSRRAIRWRFIPPGAPFMGGAWERLVRSVKNALVTVLREKHPKEETLTTLLAEVEYTLNSRPLTHVSVNPDDPEALTPNHFLMGGQGPIVVPSFAEEHNYGLSHNLRVAQQLADEFWTRWIKEYLPELRNRREPHGRGPTPKIGDLVQIVDGTLPRNVWVRGRICATHPGPDGVTRTVDIQTRGGILRRPTKKIIVITYPEESPSCTKGE